MTRLEMYTQLRTDMPFVFLVGVSSGRTGQ